MAQLQFNAQQVAPSTGQLDAMPKGWYNAVIEDSEMKPTRDGTGAYLELKLNIISGRYQNRKVFARLNLQNANPIAQEIAYKDLSAICHATGILSVQDSAQLHNIPLKIRLKVRKETDEYDASNEISAYRNINEQVKLADEENAPAVGAGTGGYQMPPQQPQQPQIPPQGQPQMPPQQMQQPQVPPQGYQQQPPQGYQQQPQQPQVPPQGQQPPQYAQQPWQQPQGQQPAEQVPQYQQQPQQPQYQQPPQQPQQPQQPQYQQPPQGQQQMPPQGQQPYNQAQLNPQTAVPPWQQPQQ